MPNPASVILRYCHESCHRLGPGRLLLALVLVIVASCNRDYISEKGSRADRVFVMANEGDATAQTALGLLYERGLGVSLDSAKALIWYRRAAKQGDALAMFHIGSLYERGDGVAGRGGVVPEAHELVPLGHVLPERRDPPARPRAAADVKPQVQSVTKNIFRDELTRRAHKRADPKTKTHPDKTGRH